MRGVEQLVAFTEDVGFGWKVCRLWFCVRRGLKSIRVSYVVRSAYSYLLGSVPLHLRGREAALLNGRCWLYNTLVNIFYHFTRLRKMLLGAGGDFRLDDNLRHRGLRLRLRFRFRFRFRLGGGSVLGRYGTGGSTRRLTLHMLIIDFGRLLFRYLFEMLVIDGPPPSEELIVDTVTIG